MADMSKVRFDIITIFPKIFDSYFGESIIKRAVAKKKAEIKIHSLRDFSPDKKHHKVDDRPFGGGAGMVLMAEPILQAVARISKKQDTKTKVIIFSAKGKQFNQKIACDWSRKYNNFVFVTGRYEGIDERVTEILSAKGGSAFGGKAEEISIGQYITTDGDVAAMVVVSALTRLIPNVINFSSLEDESFIRTQIKKRDLEYPHYTRPEILVWKGKKYRVPPVLLTGNHKKVEGWRDKKRKARRG